LFFETERQIEGEWKRGRSEERIISGREEIDTNVWLKDSRPASELQRPEGATPEPSGRVEEGGWTDRRGGRREREEREAVQIRSG
jgi:hypothetical protein